MKRFIGILFLLFGTLAYAQVRSYSDMTSKTFIVGLDSYFYGPSGTLDFNAGDQSFQVSVSPEGVTVNGQRLGEGGDAVVGVHDFTNNRVPELVLALRHPSSGAISISIYALQDTSWASVGQMEIQDADQVRIFRQVISARSGEVLQTWTWRDQRFDYKASK